VFFRSEEARKTFIMKCIRTVYKFIVTLATFRWIACIRAFSIIWVSLQFHCKMCCLSI